jgi:hypothetical protein
MATIEHVAATASPNEIIERLQKDGAVIVDKVLPADDVARLNSELSPFLTPNAYGRDEFTGFKTQRIGALLARSKACADLALNATMLSSARQYLSDYCDDIQLHFTSAVAIAPGESAQILHRDRGIWGGYLPRKIEPLFSTIWATTPFTRANGATQVVPGSQYWDKDRQPESHEIAYAEMEPGSVLCYTGTVLHGGGANSTPDQVRTGVFMHYALSWLRQEENQYLSCPPEHARRLSPELRALIGYAKGGYVLGFYSDPDDPSAAYESVSPEHLFSQREERFGAIHGADHVVSESMK